MIDFLLQGNERFVVKHNGPTPPRRRGSPEQRSPPRKWTRKCCGVIQTEEEYMAKQRGDGFVRMTKCGEVVTVPWNDPLPSVLFKHVATRQDRSCLDFENEPIFTSFSGRFALTRNTRPVELGLRPEADKVPASVRRHRAHKQLEQEQREALDILPPPARQPRLPVPVAEAVDIYDDDDDDDYEDQSDNENQLAAAAGASTQCYESPSWSLPPSTALSPASQNKTTAQQQQHQNRESIVDISPRRFPLFSSHGTGAAAMEHHVAPSMMSVPRPSHSPRALKQFMSPRIHGDIIIVGGTPRRQQQHQEHSNSPNKAAASSASARPASARYGYSSSSAASSPVRPEDFPSPARSEAPMRVTDLVKLMAKRPRPHSARISMPMLMNQNNGQQQQQSSHSPVRPSTAGSPRAAATQHNSQSRSNRLEEFAERHRK